MCGAVAGGRSGCTRERRLVPSLRPEPLDFFSSRVFNKLDRQIGGNVAVICDPPPPSPPLPFFMAAAESQPVLPLAPGRALLAFSRRRKSIRFSADIVWMTTDPEIGGRLKLCRCVAEVCSDRKSCGQNWGTFQHLLSAVSSREFFASGISRSFKRDFDQRCLSPGSDPQKPPDE